MAAILLLSFVIICAFRFFAFFPREMKVSVRSLYILCKLTNQCSCPEWHTVFRGLDRTGLDCGLVKRGLVKRGLVKRGLVKRGLVKRGLVKRGLVKRGLVKRGLVKRGLVKMK